MTLFSTAHRIICVNTYGLELLFDKENHLMARGDIVDSFGVYL